MQFALSQKAMSAFLDLLKLGLDFSSINNVEEVMDMLEISGVTTHVVCRSCGEDPSDGCLNTW